MAYERPDANTLKTLENQLNIASMPYQYFTKNALIGYSPELGGLGMTPYQEQQLKNENFANQTSRINATRARSSGGGSGNTSNIVKGYASQINKLSSNDYGFDTRQYIKNLAESGEPNDVIDGLLKYYGIPQNDFYNYAVSNTPQQNNPSYRIKLFDSEEEPMTVKDSIFTRY